MERKALFRDIFCILPLDLGSVGTSNMAAIKRQQTEFFRADSPNLWPI